MEQSDIEIRGAREHNLKNVNLTIPRDSLVVFTGVSGSGKSSLAFDTLYAEGQRRYVESLSSYARQFLGQLPKPDVDHVGGLSPAISIQQKSASRNPRSTVGTVTEVSDFLRVLFARVGLGHCPNCSIPITAQTREQIISRILTLPQGTSFLVLAPIVRGQKGEFKDLFADLLRRGFVRARVDGRVVRLSDDLRLDKRIKHDIEIVIDRLRCDAKSRIRIAEAVDQALGQSDGNIVIAVERDGPMSAEPGKRSTTSKSSGADKGSDAETVSDSTERQYSDQLLSAKYACTQCQTSFVPPTPQLFSFNSPQGMCLDCDGLGTRYAFDEDRLIPDPKISLMDGCIPLLGAIRSIGRWRKHIYEGVAKTLGIDLSIPWVKMPPEHQRIILDGAGDRHITFEWKQRGGAVWKHGGPWEGVIPQLTSSFKKAASGPRRAQLEKYMRIQPCRTCSGQRLNPQARAVRVDDKTLIELGRMPIGDLVPWFDRYMAGLDPLRTAIAGELMKEIRTRLGFLLNVGLHYLTLDRPAPTLSGGESQRIRLAGQIGSGLVGVLYVLDEPSIGLHPRDNQRLLDSLLRLRDMGNTVVVVEHDEDTMRSADFLVDFGPGPGVRGGEIVSAGPPAEVMADPKSITGKYLCGAVAIETPKTRRKTDHGRIRIVNARHNNLKGITAEFPLGTFCCVTGVSGSGKSSLVNEILLEGLNPGRAGTGGTGETGGSDSGESDDGPVEEVEVIGRRCDRIQGAELIDKVIAIDQSPIGRTPRSNPATYIKVFDEIRDLFAQMPEAKTRGYQGGRFSFNRPEGRCEACEGNGSNRLEMDFLADVWVTCTVCDGRRFNRETLQVRYRGKSIHDVLEMDVQQAMELFENIPKVHAMLKTLHDVGLDYIKLGQASPTLSGGEAQRIKLAKELCRRSTGKTVYVLDEPTTGLHFEDIRKLLSVLHGFVESGNTVIVIEHHLDVIKTADWVLDLGPEGGIGGGRLVAVGTPEKIAESADSHTGQALKELFRSSGSAVRAATPVRRTIPKSTHLVVQGAAENNLKNVSVQLPRDQMSVFCGPSGSGKSTLALDTIYSEGQRRYVESLSSYARQFLGQVRKPRVESVDGLSPAISIEQKSASRSPRSTVGTITEIHDYLRVLYARIGTPHCPHCRVPIGTQSTDEIVERVLALPDGTKLYLLAPVERKGNESYDSIFDELRRSGYNRIRLNGKTYLLDDLPEIDHRRKHEIDVVVDRSVVRSAARTRLADSVEQALALGKGVMRIAHVDPDVDERKWRIDRFSRHLACEQCGRGYESLQPHHFSFNSPIGWCPSCEGLGTQRGADLSLLIRDDALTLREGAVDAWPELTPNAPFTRVIEAVAKETGLPLDTPVRELSAAHRRILTHGSGEEPVTVVLNKSTGHTIQVRYKGLFSAVDEASRVSFQYRQRLDQLVGEVPCPACHGSRMRPDAAAYRLGGKTLGEIGLEPIGEVRRFFEEFRFSDRERKIAADVIREVRSRLAFLDNVGLHYLSLSRSGPTLSGGESQRIRLAGQIGSGLTGVLYVLDEPTIGLHPRDNGKLLQALKNLRDLGNTMVVVEHDREVIAAADYVLDFGPGAGINGGEITGQGSPKKLATQRKSLTADYLAGRKAIAVPTDRRISRLRMPTWPKVRVRGARWNNLRGIDVEFPLGCFTAVTGVSGSGKSSLVNEVLYYGLARRLNKAKTAAAGSAEFDGLELVDKVINVDQDPLGNSPSSNPATYSGVFDLIRKLYSQMPESKVRGYQARRFSFNQPGGRCEACEGNGRKCIEMHFLPDVWVTCEECNGARFNPETLAVKYKGKSIADVLQMSIDEAMELFGNIPKIRTILQTLTDVGLGYLSLGQAAPTLSGGEAQRVKLAAELARPSTGKTVYILDEPTTGLHFDDVRKLLDVLHRLVDLGNTVMTVEHNLDVIKTADWVIDMGPEAGDRGGSVVFAGTVEDLVAYGKSKKAEKVPSHTAEALVEPLKRGPHEPRQKYRAGGESDPRPGDLELDQIGKDADLPWKVDGRAWHLEQRITTDGKPCRWQGAVLGDVEKAIREAGAFSETDWSERTVVEICGVKKSQGWFFHAHTGMEWMVRLVFRVCRNEFKQGELAKQLGLKPLDEMPELPIYGREDRVKVANRRGPWQEVWMLVHRTEEIETPGFQKFLARAIGSFQKAVGKMTTSLEDVMPWKVDGEKWHLGNKGFPPGRKIQWDLRLLPVLLKAVTQADSKLRIEWDARDGVMVKHADVSRWWARIRTKSPEALDLKLQGKPGHMNLARWEGLGRDAEIIPERADGGELLSLNFLRDSDLPVTKLVAALRIHLQGFLEFYRRSED